MDSSSDAGRNGAYRDRAAATYEDRPAEGPASTPHEPSEAAWARRWPMDEIWVTRKQ